MSHRLGVCSSCDAKYKIPASFTANQAKCKSCGGVVNISDAEGEAKPAAAAAPPVPARKVAPKPAAPKSDELVEVKGSGKKRSGPSMKERLLAQRQADEAAAAKPAPKPAAAKPAAKAAAKPAARRTGAAASKRRGDSEKPGAGRGAGRARAGAGSSRRSAGRGRSQKDAERPDDEEGSSRGRRGAARKKSSPMPALIAVALLVLAGVGGWLFMNQDDGGPVEAGGSNENQVANADGAATENTGETGETPDEGAGDTAETPDEPGDDETAATEDTPKEDPKPEKETPKAAKAGPDPSSIDLTEIEDFGPVDGMTDEEFAEITDLANTMVDPEAGAAGNRARKKLTELGRLAFPALINKFKTLDFSTEQGFRDGDIIQATLRDICGGMSFGWKFSIEAKDELYNKKAVRNWANNWRTAQTDMVRWEAMTKKKTKKAEEAANDGAEFSEDSMDDLDDL